MARQFNLIPPVCEQAEYHYFQRDKVEVQLPELYHKIGESPPLSCSVLISCSPHLIFIWLHPDASPAVSGVGAMTWSPLACGLITGKYSDGVPECSRAAMKVSLIGAELLGGIPLAERRPESNSLCDRQGRGPARSALYQGFSPYSLTLKGYQWLKERVNSEEGRRQLVKIKELHLLADRLGCTAAQLAIGKKVSRVQVLQTGIQNERLETEEEN